MFLRAYVVVSSLALVVLATAAFRQSGAQRFGEITVERINVVDADGTLRLVVSNKSRMHPGVVDGVTIERTRDVAGLLFFNDEGDEVGGLTYTGRAANGTRTADGSLTFDQLKQDQTIGIRYGERDGRRTAGLEVWDRSDRPISELIAQLNAANRIADGAQREAAVKKVRDAAPAGPRRVFVGKNPDRAATVTLADANGRPRLTLTVDAAGDPRIEFLDEAGKVTSRLPAR
jgi:hypothetical protein